MKYGQRNIRTGDEIMILSSSDGNTSPRPAIYAGRYFLKTDKLYRGPKDLKDEVDFKFRVVSDNPEYLWGHECLWMPTFLYKRIVANLQEVEKTSISEEYKKKQEENIRKCSRITVISKMISYRMFGKGGFVKLLDNVEVMCNISFLGEETFNEIKNIKCGEFVYVEGFDVTQMKFGSVNVYADVFRRATSEEAEQLSK